MVVALAQRHDIIFIQESHGGEHDARRLKDLLRTTHKVFTCPHPSVRAGGVVTIIKNPFIENFDVVLPPICIVPGRVMAIDLEGKGGNCRLTNVHNEPSQTALQQCALIDRILGEGPSQDQALHIVGGDFNFVPVGEARFNATSSEWAEGDTRVAKHWAVVAKSFTEWHQEQFTRGQNCEAGFVMARLDRVYSNHFLIDVYDSSISAAAEGNIHEASKLSDHLVVSASFVRKRRAKGWRPIPSWVCRHPYFNNACVDAMALSPFSGGSIVEKVLWAKQILRNSARRVIDRAQIRGARTIPEQLHWICSFLRALRSGNHRMAYKAASAFPEIWKFARQTNGGDIDLHDTAGLDHFLSTLMESDIDTRIASIEASTELPEYKTAHDKAKLNEWRRQWASVGRCKKLQAAKDEMGNVITDPDVACAMFSDHWSGVFCPKDIDVAAARAFLTEYARPLPRDVRWVVSQDVFEKIIARSVDSSTGPDGLPYSAWQNAPQCIRSALYDLYVALLSSDAEPAANFNHAWLLLLQKGDDAQDDEIVARAAENTRPLSASNTDCKLIASAGNEPLSQSLPGWAREEQRGFVKTRQLIDNVIDIDTDCRIASLLCESGAALALFDYAAAFPSIAWLYLFLVLEFSGVPSFYINFVKKLYSNAKHYLRFRGRTQYAFTPSAGTKQGCPLSGSLFVMIVDPMLALLSSRIGPRDSIRAFADDLAAVIWKIWWTLPGLVHAFDLIAQISHLRLKIKKTVLVPLWKCEVKNLRVLIKELIPTWAEIGIGFKGKYLGFMLGPGAGNLSWEPAADKWESRARTIRELSVGLLGTILQYNTFAVSCLGFVSQLEHAPIELLRKEAKILQRLTHGPYNAFSANALVNFRQLGFPTTFTSVRAMNLAAMYRAALYTSKCFGSALARYNQVLSSDEICLRALTSDYFGVFEKPPMVVTLDNISRHLGFPKQVQLGIIRESDEILKRRKSRYGKMLSIQKQVYEIYNCHVHPFVAEDYLTRRVGRWTREWAYFPEPRTLAKRALKMLRSTYRRPMPCVIAAVLKTLLNGWVTERRFQSVEGRQCQVGCEDGDDCIEHYAVCPSVLAAWDDFSGLPSPNGPLGFFCLGSENSNVLKLRMAFLYCCHSVISKLHSTSAMASVHTLILHMRERKRFVAGASAELREALKEVRAQRTSLINASWPTW